MNEIQTIDTNAVINASSQQGDIITAFLQSLDVKQTTKNTYRKALKQFTAYINNNGIQQTDKRDIIAYKAYLTANYTASTVSAYITAVKSLYKWLESEKIYPNITAGVKGAKGAKGFKKDTLTVYQTKDILQAMPADTTEQLRDKALITLLLHTGLRTIEAERANIEDIRQEAGQSLLYIQGKGRDSKDEFVILTPATLKPLQSYLNSRGEKNKQAPLFCSFSNRSKGERLTTRSIRRIIKSAMRKAGIDSDRLTAHSLRHTAITYALLGGATIQEAQQMARHSSVNTTLIYAHNIERLKSAPESKIDSYLSAFA